MNRSNSFVNWISNEIGMHVRQYVDPHNSDINLKNSARKVKYLQMSAEVCTGWCQKGNDIKRPETDEWKNTISF